MEKKMNKKHLPLFAAICLSAAAFISCGSTKVASNLEKVYVTNTTKVDVLPVDAIFPEFEKYQQFQGSFGDTTLNALAYIQAGPTGIEVLLMNDFGGEIGSISYDGANAKLDSSVFPKKLKAEYIILDLQNAYADTQKLKEHYSKYDLEFCEIKTNISTKDGGGFSVAERAIAKDGKVIETITIGNGVVKITNLLRGYEYKLTASE